jgi:hypothetical protein
MIREQDMKVRTGLLWLRIRTRDDAVYWLVFLLCIWIFVSSNTGQENGYAD